MTKIMDALPISQEHPMLSTLGLAAGVVLVAAVARHAEEVLAWGESVRDSLNIGPNGLSSSGQ